MIALLSSKSKVHPFIATLYSCHSAAECPLVASTVVSHSIWLPGIAIRRVSKTLRFQIRPGCGGFLLRAKRKECPLMLKDQCWR